VYKLAGLLLGVHFAELFPISVVTKPEQWLSFMANERWNWVPHYACMQHNITSTVVAAFQPLFIQIVASKYSNCFSFMFNLTWENALEHYQFGSVYGNTWKIPHCRVLIGL